MWSVAIFYVGERSDRRRRRSRTTMAIPNDKGLLNRALPIASLRKSHEIGRRCFTYYCFTKFIKVAYVVYMLCPRFRIECSRQSSKQLQFVSQPVNV